jgi:glutathione S-transferase
MLGDTFSAADVLYGSAVQFFKGSLFPPRKHYDDYLARLSARPAYQRAQAKDNG